MNNEQELFTLVKRILSIKSECGYQLIEELNMTELTLKQLEYLRALDHFEDPTISNIAEELGLSKPSITAMVKKFIKLDCATKEQCPQDGRVQYVQLTERGERIAHFEDLSAKKLSERMIRHLNEDELASLVRLLQKIE